jgi:ATP-binding cassette subfamily B protein
MEQGKVVQRGTHEALVGEEGLYADLYEKQLLEEEIQAL